jgi:chromatin segregation and condensation protein Rec8/ScpA/Scc1 (kleisin family)
VSTRVELEIFEGPLDLLLHLIKKNEVSITDIPIATITEQYLATLDLLQSLSLDVAGEFLVMASTLMYIKSRELLPVDQQVEVEGEEEGEDPRWELIRQLVEYKKFKDAAAQLQAFELRQENVFPRLPPKLEAPADAAPKPEVSIFDLLNAVREMHAHAVGFQQMGEDRAGVFTGELSPRMARADDQFNLQPKLGKCRGQFHAQRAVLAANSSCRFRRRTDSRHTCPRRRRLWPGTVPT